ncbi:hypothetical protein [Iodobacter fluviatilis]|uniref:Uncharacterized protein n=1 Tax=Iodobacter fluviatilis TaxID=537 RepID=A0A377Q817_9NEIS|nr:hypothetical protein [Iodobacter fluviatilis]TCU89515.1 hypothetical protein EV682_102427 [Iodobacter fluviatilis]STQ90885.1 Uncharacterised protein [Iodobacter fluviatilis]
MDLIQKEILLAAVRVALQDKLSPEETVAVALRSLDHEMMGPDGRSFNPARISGVGSAIYAAMFNYPLDLLDVPEEGFVWRAKIPKHRFSTPFEQLLTDGERMVEQCRQKQKDCLSVLNHL